MNIDSTLAQKIITGIEEARKANLTPALAYERVSSKAQGDEGISLEYQEFNAEHYAHRKKIQIVHSFIVVESAKEKGRKNFNLMLDAALQYGIKDLIFKNTDRMCRNYHDWQRVQDLVDKHGYNIHFYQPNRVINVKSNYNDRFILDIEVATAKQLSQKISHDIREVHQYKAEQGISYKWPFGYAFDKKQKKIIIDRENENLCRYIFDEFDNNRYSLNRFVDLLNEQGYRTQTGRPWRVSQLHRMLTNPFYHGEFMYKGELRKGSHDAYYDKQRYLERIEKLGCKYVGAKKRDFEFLLAGFLKCKCGRIMSGDFKKGQYIYYRHVCPNSEKQIYLQEDAIFDMLDAMVKEVQFNSEFAEYLKELFVDSVSAKKKETKSELAMISRKISQCELEQERLVVELARGEINRDVVRKGIDTYQKQIDNLNKQRQTLSVDHHDFIFKVSDIIDTLRDMPSIYLAAPRLGKAEIIRSMADGAVIDGDNLELIWKKPYSFLLCQQIIDINKGTIASVRNRPSLQVRWDLNYWTIHWFLSYFGFGNIHKCS